MHINECSSYAMTTDKIRRAIESWIMDWTEDDCCKAKSNGSYGNPVAFMSNVIKHNISKSLFVRTFATNVIDSRGDGI